mgnify:CR=1 FL=1
MEHFNHKFNRLKKELVDISLNLNKFKSENHSTLIRIIDNLTTIPKNSNIQTISKNNEQKIDYHKTNIPNNNRKKLFYTKKSISLEKNSQYPFYDDKRNKGKICLSTTNLKYRNSNNTQRRSNTGNLNNNNSYKEKFYIKNENKIEKNALYGKFNNLQIDTSSIYKSNKYDDESAYNFININSSKERMKRLKKYKEINDKFLLDKENQNINTDYNFNNNYNLDKNDRDNIVNIYSYNHNHHYNGNRNNTLNFNYNIPYNELISKFSNDINKNNINENCLLSNKNNLEKNIERIDINNIGYNHSNKFNNKIINNLNNISQKVKADNSFKKSNINNNDNDFRNNQKINILKEKLLNNKNNDYRKNINCIKEDIIKTKNVNENNHDSGNKIQIFKNLGVNNIEEAKIKIKKLKIYQKFYDEIKKIYLGYDRENKNYNSNNILLWIYEISQYYSNSNYISFFEDIMKEYDVKSFEEFKIVINDYINRQ